jgi:divalent metal cation (Fe/Co/Zn/Cd) transporter
MKTIKIIWTCIVGFLILVTTFFYLKGEINATTLNQQLVTDMDTAAWFLGTIAVTLVIHLWNNPRLETPKPQ